MTCFKITEEGKVMGLHPDAMIKKVITEAITEEMFRDFCFFVVKFGKEFSVSPITQLENFLNNFFKEKGVFKIDKGDPNFLNPSDYFDMLPDFIICHKSGYINFLEVKYRHNGCLWEKDKKLFSIYPEALLLVMNSGITDKDTDAPYAPDIPHEALEEFKNSRFHIYTRGEDMDDKNFHIDGSTLTDWLKEFDDISESNIHSVIDEYEHLLEKWIPVTKQ